LPKEFQQDIEISEDERNTEDDMEGDGDFMDIDTEELPADCVGKFEPCKHFFKCKLTKYRK